jgi:O-antigen/teichoic acid export membrane protein
MRLMPVTTNVQTEETFARRVSSRPASLTSGSLLARNTLWNLIGNAAPIVVAAVCIPNLIRSLGKDRFGVLTLAWALIGYAGLFDLGLGRALTKLVSEKLGTEREQEIGELFWTTQLIMMCLAFAGAVLLVCISPWLVSAALKIPAPLQKDSLRSFYALSLSLPLIISTAGLRGFLEAYQKFQLINFLRVPMGVFTFVGPIVVLNFSNTIFSITVALVAARTLAWIAHLLLCLRITPILAKDLRIRAAGAFSIIRIGGWMTVSNIIGPMMLYMDRFVIGALVSAAAVTYYATSYEVVTKILIISNALSGVMFPAFSLASSQDTELAKRLYGRAMKHLMVVVVPLTLILIPLARPSLTFWLGAEFAANSFRVAQFLLIGTLALAFEALPFAFIQGSGRPDIPAKLNLVELPLYALGLYWLIQRYGVTGAAAAWALRALIDAVLLVWFTRKLQRERCVEASGRQFASAVP